MMTAGLPIPPAATPPPGAPVHVHPGRLAVAADLRALVTVVGSGVALCLWDPVSRVGGMAHFLLPEAGSAAAASRYGDFAMRTLVEELTRAGARPVALRARLYGGSAPPIESASGHIGDRNVAAALAFLHACAIPLVERDVGGAGARKVTFSPRDGATELVRIRPA